MKISDMNWMQVEAYLAHDDRAIVPLGSTEQHAYLSLTVDCTLAERVAQDAAEPLGIPVFPTVNYGLTPYFTDYPGTVSLKMSTYLSLIGDILDNLAHSGFKRILMVNGHGGNLPAHAFAQEWMQKNPDVCVCFHSWWAAPKTMDKVHAIDPVASHASWMENFPWTRLANIALPQTQKTMIDHEYLRTLNPTQVKDYIGDGNFGGYYQLPDEDILALWQIAVEETRAVMENGWPET